MCVRASFGPLVVALVISGCEHRDLAAVGSTGVYQPDAGCTTREEGGSACPSAAQFRAPTSWGRSGTCSRLRST